MMSRAMRNELNKLRELVHFLLQGAGVTPRAESGALLCYFCREQVADYADDVQHGNATGPKLDIKLTIHHVDGNHSNTTLSNEALCHTTCHKRFHRQKTNEEQKLKRALVAQGEK